MVWFRDMLAGKDEFAKPFFYQCIEVGKPYYQNKDNIYFEVTNKSDIPFYLINGIKNAPGEITLAANSVTRVVVSKKAKVSSCIRCKKYSYWRERGIKG